MIPPPPGRKPPLFITTHAIERYQQRIENVPNTEVIRRLRAIVEPHRQVPSGTYEIESRKVGPPVRLKLSVDADDVAVLTIFPVTNAQIVRAAKDRNWSV